MKNILDGKRIIFIGNSFTYYGKTVLDKGWGIVTQKERNDDKGYFYELCKRNGARVSVTNWTFGRHDFKNLFEGPCSVERPCKGTDHLSYLEDRCFDYVIMQQGSASANISDFLSKCEMVMGIFKEANPDAKFVFLIQAHAHMNGYRWLSEVKELEKKGVIIVDWGKLVSDIIAGNAKVLGAKEEYNKNTFIIKKSEADGFHPNMLTGYITTLMTYCAITGESAVNQDYSFCNDSSVNEEYDFKKFCDIYYTYDNATTNFPAVFDSPEDMRGIQTLIDRYLKEKAYVKK